METAEDSCVSTAEMGNGIFLAWSPGSPFPRLGSGQSGATVSSRRLNTREESLKCLCARRTASTTEENDGR